MAKLSVSTMSARPASRSAGPTSGAALDIDVEHRRFLEELPLSFSLGDYLFVHAGIRPGVPLDEQSPTDLLTIREPFLSWLGPLPKVVVHGHTAVRSPTFLSNRINVDTGAYVTGRLTCLALEDRNKMLV